MIPAHLDIPTWTNAGGVIVLPLLVSLTLLAAIALVRGWR